MKGRIVLVLWLMVFSSLALAQTKETKEAMKKIDEVRKSEETVAKKVRNLSRLITTAASQDDVREAFEKFTESNQQRMGLVLKMSMMTRFDLPSELKDQILQIMRSNRPEEELRVVEEAQKILARSKYVRFVN